MSTKRRGYISWKANYMAISNDTWVIPNPADRLAAAKQDLRNGTKLPEDTIVGLTEGQLAQAFKHVPEQQQKILLERRNNKAPKGAGSRKRGKVCVL